MLRELRVRVAKAVATWFGELDLSAMTLNLASRALAVPWGCYAGCMRGATCTLTMQMVSTRGCGFWE